MAKNATPTAGGENPSYTGKPDELARLTVEDFENAIDELFYMRGDEGTYYLIQNQALQCMKKRLGRLI